MPSVKKKSPPMVGITNVPTNIRYFSGLYGMSVRDLAGRIKISYAALYKKLNNPRLFRAGELDDISRIFRLSVPQLMGQLKPIEEVRSHDPD